MNVRRHERRAISPIVATVLIVAATLIAFAAVAGYVFGIFGSAGNTANIGATSSSLSHTGVGAPTTAGVVLLCQAGAPAAYWGEVVLSNSGSASGTASTFSLSYSGNTYSAAMPAGCTVTSGANENVWITGLAAAPTAALVGQAFNGFVTTNSGAQATFTGTWS
jgi:flagellin-like protein